MKAVSNSKAAFLQPKQKKHTFPAGENTAGFSEALSKLYYSTDSDLRQSCVSAIKTQLYVKAAL